MSELTPEPAKSASSNRLALAAVLAPIVLIGGCAAMLVFPWKLFAPTAANSSPAVVSKYSQTWQKEYKATTCHEWASLMTEPQRWAAAADILTAARNKIDGGSGLPKDSVVTAFEQEITTGCEGSDQVTILEVAYVIYNDGGWKP